MDRLLAATGRDVLADVVGADRQLAVAAVDEDRELHGAGPAEVAERVERGADGAAGEEHVVDEDDEPAVDAVGGMSVSSSARRALEPQVVAVERDVERAGRRRSTPSKACDPGGQPAGERGAAGRDAEQDDVGAAAGLLEQLVGHAGRRRGRRRGPEDGPGGGGVAGRTGRAWAAVIADLLPRLTGRARWRGACGVRR